METFVKVMGNFVTGFGQLFFSDCVELFHRLWGTLSHGMAKFVWIRGNFVTGFGELCFMLCGTLSPSMGNLVTGYRELCLRLWGTL